MSEILFRGKEIETGKWRYGDLLHFPEIDGKKAPRIFVNIHDEELGIKDNSYRVYPETVGQFTGLTDKNGTKVFNKQPVRFFFNDLAGNEYDEEGYIEYDEKMYCLILVFGDTFFPLMDLEFSSYDLEIIGNIHETK